MSKSKKTYRGSCNCKAITFEVEIDLSEGTTKCNCTFCWKRRYWGVTAAPNDFRLTAGAKSAQLGERGGHCRECGVSAFKIQATDGWDVDGMAGDQVSINVACLDDLPLEELLAAPVYYLDGKSDAWDRSPPETRHL